MAVKIGNSWVSEAALTYAKGVTNSGQSTGSDVLKSLSEKYKDTNFIASTEPFQGKGTNNIGISPNILRQMEQDPEKRLEYEALIYDCVQTAKSAPVKTANGSDIAASGFIINADGSLGGWSITKSNGEKTRNQTKLDKKDKESWQKKLYEKQKEKSAKRKEQQKERMEKSKEESQTGQRSNRYTQAVKADSVSIEFSSKGMELAKQQSVMAFVSADNTYGTFSDKKEFMDYLSGKYPSVKNGIVSISGAYLRECMKDEKKQEELLRLLDDAEYMVKDSEEHVKGYQGMKIRIDDKGNMETETYGSSVGFNEGKRARQLSAAKTVDDVQLVMGLLQKDLTDCQAGLENGACDENEVAKVRAMIARAQQRMAELKGEDFGSGNKEDSSGFYSMNLLM